MIGVTVLALLPFVLLTPRAPKPPALGVVVLKDGQVAYQRSFGLADRVSGRAAAPDGIYHFWSVTDSRR